MDVSKQRLPAFVKGFPESILDLSWNVLCGPSEFNSQSDVDAQKRDRSGRLIFSTAGAGESGRSTGKNQHPGNHFP